MPPKRPASGSGSGRQAKNARLMHVDGSGRRETSTEAIKRILGLPEDPALSRRWRKPIFDYVHRHGITGLKCAAYTHHGLKE